MKLYNQSQINMLLSSKKQLMHSLAKNRSKIIGITGVSAAGKSTLTRALASALNITAIFWDDYEKISEEPLDYFEWFQSNRNYDAWKYDILSNILKALRNGKTVICPTTKTKLKPTKYIIFEAPLGRKHLATGRYIDFLIFLDTDPDIALARRLLRDYRASTNVVDILSELESYIKSSRPIYLWSHEAKNEANLIIDSKLPLDVQVQLIIKALK